MPALPRISTTDLDSICRILADAATHKELSLLLKDSGIAETGGTPRWEKMFLALSARQEQDHCANNVVNFISRVLHPSRFAGEQEKFDGFRNSVNTQLAFYGLHIGEDGKPKSVTKADTLPEAEQRANELQAELRCRVVSEDVLKFCRAELLKENYFHCVLEAAKSLFQKIRDKTGLDGDGATLVENAFSIKNPRLAVNKLETETERMEQTGFSNFLKGIYGIYRTVPAHAPKIHWSVDKKEALDALTIISYASRRLDETIVVPKTTP